MLRFSRIFGGLLIEPTVLIPRFYIKKQHTRLSVLLLQLVEKSLAEFRVRRRESNTIRFLPRHVRGGKHFARSERRIVRYQRTTEAQSAAKLSRKSGKATFSTVSKKQHTRLGVLLLWQGQPILRTGNISLFNSALNIFNRR